MPDSTASLSLRMMSSLERRSYRDFFIILYIWKISYYIITEVILVAMPVWEPEVLKCDLAGLAWESKALSSMLLFLFCIYIYDAACVD